MRIECYTLVYDPDRVESDCQWSSTPLGSHIRGEFLLSSASLRHCGYQNVTPLGSLRYTHLKMYVIVSSASLQHCGYQRVPPLGSLLYTIFLCQPPNFLNKNEQLSELICSLIHFACLLKTIVGCLKFIQIRIGLTQRF